MELNLIERARQSIGAVVLAAGQKMTRKGFGRARMEVKHQRRFHWADGAWKEGADPRGQQLYHTDAKGEWAPGPDPKTGEGDEAPWVMRTIGPVEVSYNLITNAGRIFLHKQGYDTTGLGSNGLNYIALSNDTVGETASSTTLSTEIAANGLTRAQGTVTLPTGSGNQTTISKVFTATGTQSAQKAALFTASSAGTMCHVLSFTQRNLINTDTLTITFTITLG